MPATCRTPRTPGAGRRSRSVAWSSDARGRGWGSRSGAVGGRLEGADVRQVPVLLREIEPVPDHELVRDIEPDVADVQLDLLDALFPQERRDLERGGFAPGEVLQQVLERETG